jgi:hypothetical protein
MKNLILILLTAFTLSCCSKDDNKPKTELEKLPPATQTGKNTFGCLLDGKAFLPYNAPNSTNCFYQLVSGKYYFYLGGQKSINDNIVSIVLKTEKKQIFQGDTYELFENIDGNASGNYLFNLDFSYFIFNLNRYEIINHWALLFIAQIVLTLYVGFKFGLFKSLAISLLVWTPSTIIFIYSAFYLLLPQRVVLPLLLLPVMIMIGVGSKTTHLSEAPKIIWPVSIVLTILYITVLTGINQSNILEKNANHQLLTDLKHFDNNATYLIPRCNNPYFSENPYKFTGKNRPIKILNVGCWDTFSPHWNNRKANFGLTSLSIYDDLFKEDVYWLGNFVPDTSINIENLLKNKGETNFTREVVKELSGDYVLFEFRKSNS